MIEAAKKNKKLIVPSILWWAEGDMRDSMDFVLKDEDLRSAVRQDIQATVKKYNLDGIDIDFENKKFYEFSVDLFLNPNNPNYKITKLKEKENKDAIVFEDSVAGIQAANIGNMISIGIGEKSILEEAQYIFKDFTQIDKSFIEQLIRK